MKIKAKPKEPIKEVGKEQKNQDGKVERKEANVEKESGTKKTVRRSETVIDKLRMKREQNGKLEPKYESWNDDVNAVALVLAQKFQYDTLYNSVHNPSSAPEVYGYLRDNYRNFRWLIDNYVLEVAVWYSKNKLDNKVRIVKVIEGIDIDKYEKSMVELDGIHRFGNYPNIPITNMIFLAEQFLDDAVYWLEDSEWILDNEEVRVNIGRFSGVLIAFTGWNVPVILVTHLPFKNIGLYKAKMDAKQIVKLEEDLKLKLINTYRSMMQSYQEQVDQLSRDAKNWKKMYSELSKKHSLEYMRTIAKIEARGTGLPSNSSLSKKTRYIILGSFIVLIIFLIIGWVV